MDKQKKTDLEEIQDIKQRLEKWMEERYLNIEKQRVGYFNNTEEEIQEYYEGYNNNDLYEIIDALCDILVFTFNAYDSSDSDRTYEVEDLEPNLGSIIYLRNKFNRNFNYNNLYNMYILIKKFLYIRNFDLYRCMLETIKEIDSRTGSYNPELKKWIKDKSPEAKANWYSANYEVGRIE